MTKIYDGEKCVMGRVGAVAAKNALNGEDVEIYNAEKMIITGNRKSIILEYKKRMEFRDMAKPEKSPKFPRRPDLFVKKSLRSMLPWRSKRGKDAFRRIKVYIGKPEKKAEKVFEIKKDVKFMSVGELCKNLGWKG